MFSCTLHVFRNSFPPFPNLGVLFLQFSTRSARCFVTKKEDILMAFTPPVKRHKNVSPKKTAKVSQSFIAHCTQWRWLHATKVTRCSQQKLREHIFLGTKQICAWRLWKEMYRRNSTLNSADENFTASFRLQFSVDLSPIKVLYRVNYKKAKPLINHKFPPAPF